MKTAEEMRAELAEREEITRQLKAKLLALQTQAAERAAASSVEERAALVIQAVDDGRLPPLNKKLHQHWVSCASTPEGAALLAKLPRIYGKAAIACGEGGSIVGGKAPSAARTTVHGLDESEVVTAQNEFISELRCKSPDSTFDELWQEAKKLRPGLFPVVPPSEVVNAHWSPTMD